MRGKGDGRARIRMANPQGWWKLSHEGGRRAAHVGGVMADLCGPLLDREQSGWRLYQADVAARARCSVRTVKRGMRDLRDDGAISYRLEWFRDAAGQLKSRIVGVQFWVPVESVRSRHSRGDRLTPGNNPSTLRSSSVEGRRGPDSEIAATARPSSRGDPPERDPFDTGSIPSDLDFHRAELAKAMATLGMTKG